MNTTSFVSKEKLTLALHHYITTLHAKVHKYRSTKYIWFCIYPAARFTFYMLFVIARLK